MLKFNKTLHVTIHNDMYYVPYLQNETMRDKAMRQK